MAATYIYTGAEERIYGAYLAVAPDGTTSTLIGTPGMAPVEIRKAGGADHDSSPADEVTPADNRMPLPDIPADGRWVPTETTPPPSAEKATKGAKAVSN